MASNKLIFAAMLAGALAAAVSCTKEERDASGLKYETEKVVLKLSDTKTTFNTDRDKLVWSNGDKLAIFTEKQDATVATPVYDGTSDLEIEVPVGSDTVFASYPYNSTSVLTRYYTSITNAQTQAEAGVMNGKYFPMQAVATINREGGSATAALHFTTFSGILALNIYNTSASAPEDAKVQSVTVTPLEADSTEIVCGGICWPSFKKYSQSFKPTTKYTSLTLTVTNPAAIPATKPADSLAKKGFASQLYISIAKKNYPQFKFEVTTSDGMIYVGTTGVNNYDFTQGKMIILGLDLSKFQTAINTNDYYSLYENGVDFTIGDKVINKTTCPDPVLVTKTTDLEDKMKKSTAGKPIFIDNSSSFVCEFSNWIYFGSTSCKNDTTILIGRYKNKPQPIIKQTVTSRPAIAYNSPYVKNVCFDVTILGSSYALLRGATITYTEHGTSNYVLEDCTVLSKGGIFKSTKSDHSTPESITFNNCIFRTDAAVISVADSVRQNLSYLKSIVMDNCVVAPYNTSKAVNVEGCIVSFGAKSSGNEYRCDDLSIDVKRCSFYNFAPSSGKSLFHATTVKDIKFQNSIVYTTAEAASRLNFTLGQTCNLNPSANNIFKNNALAKFVYNPGEYSSTKKYSIDDKVKYEDNIYKCNISMSAAEEWNPEHWTLVGPYGDKITWKSTSSKNKIIGGENGTNKYEYSGVKSDEFVFGTVDVSKDYYPSAYTDRGATYDTKYWVGK